jgi:hypothetical protein
MGAGQPEIFTDELDQKSPVLTLAGNGASVHGHRYIRHKIPPWGVQSSLTLLASFSFFEKGSTSKLGIMFTKATPDGWGEPTGCPHVTAGSSDNGADYARSRP